MGKGKRKGRSVRRNRQIRADEPDELKRAAHSFVISRGRVGKCVSQLTKDFRKVMEPFTASSLKARKRNTIKDFVSTAGLLHVSHMIIFTHTEQATYMKVVRFPRGPTLTFKIHSYSLARDVISSIKKQLVYIRQFQSSPLIVLNSFSGEGQQMKLMTSMFQNMFPTINLTKVNLNDVRRCVLFNYNPTSKLIDFRHYAIKVVPVGISRGVKKIVQSKVPNLGHFQDISDFVTKSNLLSESEAEDDPASHVILPQRLTSRGNTLAGKSGVRLLDIGPRLTIQLVKVEDGLLSGEILHHEIVHKSEDEVKEIKKRREERSQLKQQRRKVQEENKRRKEKQKEQHKQKSLEGMKNKSAKEEVKEVAAECEQDEQREEEEEDDDAEWYRKEVGLDPDKELFESPGQKRKNKVFGALKRKKQKLEDNSQNKKSQEKPRIHPRHNISNKRGFKKSKALGNKLRK